MIHFLLLVAAHEEGQMGSSGLTTPSPSITRFCVSCVSTNNKQLTELSQSVINIPLCSKFSRPSKTSRPFLMNLKLQPLQAMAVSCRASTTLAHNRLRNRNRKENKVQSPNYGGGSSMHLVVCQISAFGLPSSTADPEA